MKKGRVRGTIKTIYNGILFASKREAKRYGELLLLEKAGEICQLETQSPFALDGRDGPIMTDSGARQRRYYADFKYYDKRLKAWVIEDAKGHATDVYKLKKAILAAMGVKIVEV